MKPVLIWDWDGTLVDSLDYKYEDIWSEIFPEDKKKQKIVISYIQTPKGKLVNRYGLIRYVLSVTDNPEIAHWDDETFKNNTHVKVLVSRYEHAVKAFLYKNGLRAGARQTLSSLFQNGYHMYIISGGGTDDSLKEIMKEFDIDKYFRAIFGFGSKGTSLTRFGKNENFSRVVGLEKNADASCYVVIGDSISDYTFTKKIGSNFIGIKNKWNVWSNDSQRFLVVSSIAEIPTILKKQFLLTT